MTTKTKLTIAGLIAAMAIGGVFVMRNGDEPLNDEPVNSGKPVCEEVQLKIGKGIACVKQGDYEVIKDNVIDLYLSGQALTYYELQILAGVLDVEAKKGKFQGMKDVKGLLPEMIKKVK